jgi:hypothetical protein
MANASQMLRHVHQLLLGVGVGHIVWLQQHLKLRIGDAARSEEQEAQTFVTDHELTSLLRSIPDDIEAREQVVDPLAVPPVEVHQGGNRLSPLLLSQLSPALCESMHEERHGRDRLSVDEAALDQDLGRPFVHELSGHASQAR